MPDNADDYVATEFHGLVSDLQTNDVKRFEEEQRRQAELRAQLRRAEGVGLNAGELLKKMDGDPDEANKKVQAELDRIAADAKAAADKLKVARDPLPDGHFPPPPESE